MLLRRPLEPGQYLSIRYTERLALAGIEPSVGSRGDSYDNALAETIIGLYKTELVYHHGPWSRLEDIELATLEWVWWFNNHRLLKPIGLVPPAEFEEVYYRELHTPAKLETTQINRSPMIPVRFNIVATANALGRAQGLPATDEKEILACLRKHDSSYANFRHFQLNKQGGLNPDLGFKPREIQVVHCLALALIQLNMDEITKRKLQVLSMSAVPESEMTADIRALKERMLER